MNPSKKIAVIDDNIDVCELVCSAAQAMGFECSSATNADTFLQMLTPDTDLILLDLVMPDMDGVELLRLLAQQKCQADSAASGERSSTTITRPAGRSGSASTPSRQRRVSARPR